MCYLSLRAVLFYGTERGGVNLLVLFDATRNLKNLLKQCYNYYNCLTGMNRGGGADEKTNVGPVHLKHFNHYLCLHITNQLDILINRVMLTSFIFCILVKIMTIMKNP